jgi:hypothetical protein
MLIGVLFAFFCARSAGYGAGLHGCGDDPLVAAGATDTDGAGSQTEISAILVEADALTELVHHLFGKAGVGAGDAGLCA